MIFYAIDALGAYCLGLCTYIGNFMLFLYNSLVVACTTKLKFKKVLLHMQLIGVDSLIIVILTGSFAGAVLAFQSYIGFKRFGGGQEFIGPLVAQSLTRELGPVLTGLMVAGRAGSAIAAEIGSMAISEQIDALRTLCINPLQYLVVPRIIAGTIILPFLTLFAMVFGTIGGYIIAVHVLHLNGEQYITGIKKYLELSDINNGLIKAGVFGFILSWVGSYKGFYTTGGARGVGNATTQSVVIGSIMIVIANYFLTAWLF